MLFLIQWLGGVYCAKKGGMNDDWVWIACIFVGWLFIIIYLIDSSKSNHNSASTNSYTSSQTKQTAPTVPFKPTTPPQIQYSPPAPAITPKAHRQSNLPIEEEILAYLKTQPVRWEYPLRSQDEVLKNFCSALVFSEPVAGINNDENIRSLELTIQQKRAKNPQLADHNTAMEGNILALLYKYSYLMHIFHAMDAIKFDTTKVDVQKLWLLIQQDCNDRIGNLEEEKKKTPAIQTIMDKYTYDHQIMQLKLLNDATGREMDYIISSVMVNSLMIIISLLFSNPQLLQTVTPYSAADIAGMMDAHIVSIAGLRFAAYSKFSH